MKPDRRRTTKLTTTAGPMLRDVTELKQAALWHGGKIRIIKRVRLPQKVW